MDNAGVFLLIFMGKGIGVVFTYGVSGLSFNIIGKQQLLYNSWRGGGGGMYVLLRFYWFLWLLCKTIPQHTRELFQKQDDPRGPILKRSAVEMRTCLPRGERPPWKVGVSHSGEMCGCCLQSGQWAHLAEWEHAGSQAVFLAAIVS